MLVYGLGDFGRARSGSPNAGDHEQDERGCCDHPCDVPALVVDIEVLGQGVSAIGFFVVRIEGYEDGIVEGGEILPCTTGGHIGQLPSILRSEIKFEILITSKGVTIYELQDQSTASW
jgi:hypothetical protein